MSQSCHRNAAFPLWSRSQPLHISSGIGECFAILLRVCHIPQEGGENRISDTNLELFEDPEHWVPPPSEALSEAKRQT